MKRGKKIFLCVWFSFCFLFQGTWCRYLGSQALFYVQAEEVVVEAPSAILIEAQTGTVIYEKNSEEIRSPASITKIMTLLLVMEAVDKENEENRMRVHISPSYKDSQLENVRKVVSRVFKDEFAKIYMHPKKKTLVIEKKGSIINFLDLSDGEKCYLALIMDIARRLESNYSSDEGMVVLIDEADLHLHPSWQLSLVDNLRSAFPTCQFFLTTHSSLLLSDLKSDENESLWVLKDGRKLTLSGSSYGDDTSYILKRYFGLQTVRNPLIQEKIDAISDELSKTDTDIEQVAEWMKQLDDMDVQYEDNARYKVLLGIKREKNEKDK